MRTFWRHHALILFAVATIVGAGAFVWKVLRPAWERPANRTYTSRMGYASVLRREGRPFPVRTAQVSTRDLDEVHVGEGLMQSTPVLVPVLPMAPITKVHVQAGDRVQAGQLLAELDASKIVIKVQSALTALETANAELQRVRVGSPQEMVDERPEADIVRLGTLAQESEIKARALEWYTDLHEQGLVAAKDLIAKELDAVSAVGRQQEAELELQTAEMGMAESLAIAESARKEAELAFEYRKLELLEYEIHAPTDGTIERVLVQPGEFNQDPGRPAFLMVSGLWFEARLDQASIGRVHEGDEVSVFLEAFPGEELSGRVRKVLPFVTFNPGGPEVSRPVRPLGTGAPEWPATFAVQVDLGAVAELELVPGLTGFIRIRSRHTALAVPRASLLSVSAATALVHVLKKDGEREVRQVRIGRAGGRGGDWVEVLEGVAPGDTVLVAGHEVLESGDRIHVVGGEQDSGS